MFSIDVCGCVYVKGFFVFAFFFNEMNHNRDNDDDRMSISIARFSEKDSFHYQLILI